MSDNPKVKYPLREISKHVIGSWIASKYHQFASNLLVIELLFMFDLMKLNAATKLLFVCTKYQCIA